MLKIYFSIFLGRRPLIKEELITLENNDIISGVVALLAMIFVIVQGLPARLSYTLRVWGWGWARSVNSPAASAAVDRDALAWAHLGTGPTWAWGPSPHILEYHLEYRGG